MFYKNYQPYNNINDYVAGGQELAAITDLEVLESGGEVGVNQLLGLGL